MQIEWLMKGSLLLAAAVAVSYVKPLPATLRHFILLLGFLGLPLMIGLEQLLPTTILALPAIEVPLTTVPTADVTAQLSESATNSLTPTDLALFAYALVAISLLLRLGRQIGATQLWVSALPIIQQTDSYRLRRNHSDHSPFAWGGLKPTIVVPANWHDWSTPMQHAALTHEQAHLQRKDVTTAIALGILCAVFWWHPLVWWARSRALRLAEQACDDAVVRSGTSPVQYAEFLLSTYKQQFREATAVAPAMAAGSDLGARVRALVSTQTRRKTMSKTHTGLVLGLTLAVCTALATTGSEVTSVSEDVRTELTRVKDYIDQEQLGAAQKAIAPLTSDATLKLADRAQVLNMLGYLRFKQSNHAGALQAYAELLALPEAATPHGLRQTTQYTLAQLHFVLEDYASAIEAIKAWQKLATNPGPRPLIFIGQSYYQLQDYESALEYMTQGLALAEARDMTVHPNWVKLKQYLEQAVRGNTGGASAPNFAPDQNAEYVPTSKVRPEYPQSAKETGTEGFVIVEFTVSETGKPVDANVIEATPPGVFDRAALDAVAKFKYNPRIVDGEPVAVPGIRNRITFTLPVGQ